MTSLLPRTLRRWLALGSCALAASCDAVTVQAPLVVSVEVVPGTVNLAVGESRQLQAVVRDEDGTPLSASQIDWSSSSPAVAGVSPTGTVSGLTAGSATVRARVGGVTGTADVVVSAAAGFRVDSTDVTFTAQAGGSTSAPKAVVISAAGAVQANALQVAVTYDAGQPTGWLSAGLSSTTTPALLTLAADADGIPVGDFGANVEISAPGYEPTTVRARLSVRGTAASIRLSRTSVAFQANSGGAVPLPQSVDVTNAGSGTLSGLTASIDYGGGPGGWLTATLQSNTAPTQLTLSARQGTLPVGTYTATVGVASTAAANSPQAVTVTFTVAQAGGAPRIGLAADTVDFAWSVGTSLPAPRSVAIRNLGGGTLSGLASSVSYAPGQPTGWLLAQLDGTTAPTALELALDPGSLGAGTYEASVEIVSSVAANSPVFLRVVFTITSGPLIALSQDSIGFSAIQGAGNPTSQSVQVSNAGTGALTGLGTQVAYTPGQPSGWLNASLSGTSAPATVTLAATTGALGAGTYTATVNVTAAGANNSPEPITVTFTVLTPAPSIGLSPTSVPFNGVVGQPSPSAATVSVTNAGGQPLTGLAVGTIAYAGGASGWLSATLSGSNAPATLTLTPSITGLAAGTYTATVPVTSPVALTRTVAVTFTVADPPAFGLNPTSLTFNATQGGGNPATQTVSVSNTGGGTLNGLSTSIQYAGATTGWLSASLAGTSAPTTLTVSAATGSLAPGTYNASITLNSTASGGVVSTPIAVAFVVAPPPPAIGLAPTSLSFSAVQNTSAPAAQTVTVTNTGGQTLSGLTATVSAGAASWLSATLNGTTAPTSITVQPSTASLSPGTYSGTVTVTAPGAANSPQTVSVTYTVAAPPSIVLSASARSFTAVQGGANPSSQSVNVTNGGGGTLDGLSASVSYGSGQPTGWLNASVGASAPTTLTLQPSVGSLGPGSYTATVSVASTAAGVTNSPQTVSVTFEVTPPPPTIGLSTTSLSFATAQNTGIPAQKTVDITNTGGQTLTGLSTSVSYQSGSNWLGSPVLNSTTAPATLIVRPTTDGLSPGTYNATITVTASGASNSPQQIAVTYTVAPPPSITLSRSSVSFASVQGGADPADQTVSVTNGGGGTLNGLSVTASGGSWLTASVSPGTAPATVTIQADLGSLGAGTYTGQVQVASTATGVTNSPRTIDVTFVVTPPPTIVISKGAVQDTVLQGGSFSDVVQITEQNGNPMPGISTSVTYVSGSGWLTPSLSSTSGPATLTLNASAAGLTPNTYTANVAILVPGATNTPRDVTVVMVVLAPPTLAVDDASKTFSATIGSGTTSQTANLSNLGSGGPIGGLSASTAYTGGGVTGWLTTSLSSTSTPSVITFTVDPATAGLVSGATYTARVTISGTGVSAVTVDISFQAQ